MRRLYTLLPLLIALLIPTGAWADEWQDPETKVNYEYTPGQGEASVKKGTLVGETGSSPNASGDITILSSFTVGGETYTVTSIESAAFSECKNITSVTIPNTVKRIGPGAFYECANLKSINIPESVTDIGSIAFVRCGLTSISIPGSVKRIYSQTFLQCTKLKTVTIGEGVIAIEGIKGPGSADGGAFSWCWHLESITLPESLKEIEQEAFGWCYRLSEIKLPKNLEKIGKKAFYGTGTECERFDVYSQIEEPFALDEVFGKNGKNTNENTLYVPAGTKAKYEATEGWKEFKNIVEMVTKGDLDGKGYTDVTDVVAAISCIMEEAGLTDEEVAILDMDGDGEVDVADIVKLIIEVIRHQKEQATAASARGRQPSAETVDLTQYTALQMTVTVPEGCEVTRMTLTGRNRDTHRLVCQQTGEGRYAVVVYSMENLPLQPVDGSLIAVEGASEVVTSNVMLSTRSRERAYLNSLPAATVTGFVGVQGAATTDAPTVYDLQGRKVNAQDMRKGMYIINGKKVVR